MVTSIKKTFFLLVLKSVLIIGIIFTTSCSDGTEKFIGKHSLNLPLYTTKYDTTVNIKEFGTVVHPEIHFYDLYSSTLDIYKTAEKKLEGKFRYVFPDKGKWYAEKYSLQEQTLELTGLHIEKDTLLFLIEATPLNPKYEGCAFMEGNNMVVGIPKKLFTWIFKSHCLENFIKEDSEFLFFVTDQIADKKTLYNCQMDSLKTFLISNPKYINKHKPTIEYLAKLTGL
jgi:hypothetical protein